MNVHPVIRLGTLLLGLISCLMASPALLGVMLAALLLALWNTGLEPTALLRSLRPWLPMVGIILLVHIFTTTAAAPLGTPTWAGLMAGLRALLRVGCTVGCLALFTRTTSVDDLVYGARWWLQPLEKLGFPGHHLGLVLAVALGTAPMVLGEGRRIETVVRLRRSGPGIATGRKPGRSIRRLLSRQMDRVRIVVPLMESLGRRAEALSLSLRARRPDHQAQSSAAPPVYGLLLLAGWLALLVWLGFRTGVTS